MSVVSIRRPVGTPPPSGQGGTGTLLFHSQWSFALGRSQNALRDGNGTSVPYKWTGGNTGSGVAGVAPDYGGDVIERGALDFSTANVLRVIATENRAGTFRVWKYGLGVPPAGWTRYYRWEMQVGMPDSWSDRSHPIEESSAGISGSTIECAHRIINAAAGFYELDYRLGSGNPVCVLDTHLSKGVTRLFEHARYRLPNGTQFQFHTRISTRAGIVLFTDADFGLFNGGVPTGQTLGDVPTFTHENANSLDGWQFGNNGQDDPGELDQLHSYQAAPAIKDVDGPFDEDDWIGTFPHPDEV